MLLPQSMQCCCQQVRGAPARPLLPAHAPQPQNARRRWRLARGGVAAAAQAAANGSGSGGGDAEQQQQQQPHRRRRRTTASSPTPSSPPPAAAAAAARGGGGGGGRPAHSRRRRTTHSSEQQPPPTRQRKQQQQDPPPQPPPPPGHLEYALRPSVSSYDGGGGGGNGLSSVEAAAAAAPAAAAAGGNGHSKQHQQPQQQQSLALLSMPPSSALASLDPHHQQQHHQQNHHQQQQQQQQLVYPVTGTTRGAAAAVRFSDSAALRLRRRAVVAWPDDGPRSALLVKKAGNAAAAAKLREVAAWLAAKGLRVYVERGVHQQETPELPPFEPGATDVDLAITLGGDGTVLHLASLFREDVPLPPVLCFALGTLGFLTPFDVAHFRSCLTRVLAATSRRRPLYCTLRTRKRCTVLSDAGDVLRVHHILNEVAVDRGAFPSSVPLELYVDGGFVTASDVDGLIVATPSGSTAYSMSAGGAIVAPSVPCTLVTPLSPHSLSFRPLIVPEDADVLVRLPRDARSHARASFDGKAPTRVARGGSVHISSSLCPLPLINVGALDGDFYEGITQKLGWARAIRGGPGGVLSSSGVEALLRQQAAAAAVAAADAAAAVARRGGGGGGGSENGHGSNGSNGSNGSGGGLPSLASSDDGGVDAAASSREWATTQ